MIPEESKIIEWQDAKIGQLTRERDFLQDSQTKRNEWLRQAKKEAGYPDAISFDVVWKDALTALLASQPTCVECKQKVSKVTDYNGHGHMVCDRCDRRLQSEFEDEYR